MRVGEERVAVALAQAYSARRGFDLRVETAVPACRARRRKNPASATAGSRRRAVLGRAMTRATGPAPSPADPPSAGRLAATQAPSATPPCTRTRRRPRARSAPRKARRPPRRPCATGGRRRRPPRPEPRAFAPRVRGNHRPVGSDGDVVLLALLHRMPFPTSESRGAGRALYASALASTYFCVAVAHTCPSTLASTSATTRREEDFTMRPFRTSVSPGST